jgi:uncharacterized membrane protein
MFDSLGFWAGVLVGLIIIHFGYKWVRTLLRERHIRRARKALRENKSRPPN